MSKAKVKGARAVAVFIEASPAEHERASHHRRITTGQRSVVRGGATPHRPTQLSAGNIFRALKRQRSAGSTVAFARRSPRDVPSDCTDVPAAAVAGFGSARVSGDARPKTPAGRWGCGWKAKGYTADAHAATCTGRASQAPGCRSSQPAVARTAAPRGSGSRAFP